MIICKKTGQKQYCTLVVEHFVPARLLIRRFLISYGHHVLLAEDARHGLDLYNKHSDSVDLIITDIVSPKTNGASLLNALLEKNSNLKFALFSGYEVNSGISDTPSDALKVLARATIPKPFSSKELKTILEKILPNQSPEL